MKILYGVVGEGMGHATRSRVVMEMLLARGHEVRVVASNRAYTFLKQAFESNSRFQIDEIHGLHFCFEGNQMALGSTIWSNLKQAPGGLRKNLRVYRKMKKEGYRPDVVFSDFDSWTYFYALNHRLPLVSIANIQALSHLKHSTEITNDDCFPYLASKLGSLLKTPGAYHYLIPSFFEAPVDKQKTTLIAPILRREILQAQREPGEHILVYQTKANNQAFLDALERLPYEFRIYGTEHTGERGNLRFRDFSETGFVEDLRTARALLGNAGFSLMGEAVHLKVPMMAVPIRGQYEQELNARYLQKLGYGDWTYELEHDGLQDFLRHVPDYQQALEDAPSYGNTMLEACLDELLYNLSLSEPAPLLLEAPSLGTWELPLPALA